MLRQDNTIYLFGRVLLANQQDTASVCLRVQNVERNVFLLPRATLWERAGDASTATDRAVEIMDGALLTQTRRRGRDVQPVRSVQRVQGDCAPARNRPMGLQARHAVRAHAVRGRLRLTPRSKYAFECRKDVEPEAEVHSRAVPPAALRLHPPQYLKIVYNGQYPALPRDLQGKTFSHAFGTNSSCLELFMLKRKLMGPGWSAAHAPAACG